jgi:hypothetical protein
VEGGGAAHAAQADDDGIEPVGGHAPQSSDADSRPRA